MDEQAEAQSSNLMGLAADLVVAYVSNNSVPVSELPNVIASVHASLSGLGSEASVEPAGPEKPTAAQIRKSITPDALISFEDRKPYKTLKRHLTLRGLTAEDYRTKYGLPADYPMTAASYSAQRSELARALGLGQKRRKAHLKAVPSVSVVAGTISEMPKPRGRPRKVAETPQTAPKARGRKKVAEPA